MASKYIPRRLKKNNISSQDVKQIKKKQPKLSSVKQNKVLPARASPFHRIDKSSTVEHRSERNGSTSSSYLSQVDDVTECRAPLNQIKRASPVIRNDLIHSRSNSAVSRVTTPTHNPAPDLEDTSPEEPSDRVCTSPRIISTVNTVQQLPENSAVETGKRSPYAVFEDSTAGTPGSGLSAIMERDRSDFVEKDTNVHDRKNDDTETRYDRESYTTEMSSGNIPADQRTDMLSRQSFTVCTSNTLSRSNSAGNMTDKLTRNNLKKYKTESLSSKSYAPCRTGTPSRSNSAVCRTGTPSRSNSAVCRTGTPSRSNSAVYKTDTPSRSNSAVCRTGTPSRSNSAVYKTDTPSRSNSAVCRTDTSARSHYAIRTDASSRNSSATYRPNSPSTSYSTGTKTNTPPRKTVVFKTDRETSETTEVDTTDKEIIDGGRIGTSSTIACRTENTANEENCARPTTALHGDSPRTSRTDMPSRGSPLMLGSAKINRMNDMETLELHFDKTDYSNLVTQRSLNRFSITGTTCSNAYNEKKISPRPTEVQLPKTYITKSGSLFLYSDSKILKDKHRQRSENCRGSERHIEVQGRKMSPRTLVPRAYPNWGKLVNMKKAALKVDNRKVTGCAKRDQREYIGISCRGSDNKPYSWNYTVLPVKLINTEEEKDVQTVNNLSEAVLAYRSRPPTTEDKYLTMMTQTRNGKTQAERLTEKAGQLERLSTWTNEWIQSQSSVKFKENTLVSKGQQNSEIETESDLIAQLRHSFQQSVQCRAPTNTPLVGAKQQKRLKISMNHLYEKESLSNASNALTTTSKSLGLMSKYN